MMVADVWRRCVVIFVTFAAVTAVAVDVAVAVVVAAVR